MTLDKEMEHDSLLSGEGERSSFSTIDVDLQVEKQPLRHLSRGLGCLRQFPWKAMITHIGIFFVYTVVLFFIVVPIGGFHERGTEVAYIPFNPGPQAQVFKHQHSIYVGEPSLELDEAWREILKNSNIRITEEEISQFPERKEQAIELPDGGYFATPNVYHNLHCIKRLHHYMYPEYYFANITQEQRAANEYHNHHCLDMLRQSIMCQGDMQLLTMKWRQDSRIPTANFTAPHQCVNWDRLDRWTSSRRIVNLMDPGYLIHPIMGPAYPEGHGDPIGEVLPHANDSMAEA